jgi:GMP synthase (glutamine-hydrolysing)
MSDARLKAKLWVQAALRACQAQGATATIARRGDADAGAVLIKQNFLDGRFIVLTPLRSSEGTRCWLRGTGAEPVAEPVADAYVARQIERDSDIWVVEIEDRGGRLPFDEPVV